jgi:hypothetical protein
MHKTVTSWLIWSREREWWENKMLFPLVLKDLWANWNNTGSCAVHYYFFTLNHIDFDSHRRYSGLVEIVHMMHKKSLCESLLLIRMNNILWCEVPQSRTKFWLGGYDQECIARQLQVLSHTAGLLCTTCILYRNQYRNQTWLTPRVYTDDSTQILFLIVWHPRVVIYPQ